MTPIVEDFYGVLGVAREADFVAIRRAYRKLARRFHPDINPNDRVVADRFRLIQQAFDTLGDPERRAEYDRSGPPLPSTAAEGAEGRFGFAGFDFSESPAPRSGAFRDLFGGGESRDPPPMSNDIHVQVRIPLVEALAGKRVQVRATREAACGACRGRGELRVAEGRACPACSGRGQALLRRGRMVFSRPCDRCGGEGMEHRAACAGCDGRGTTSGTAREIVRLPPGVADGAAVTVVGKGHERIPGAPPGDLVAHVAVEPHRVIERRGDNLICPLPVTVAEAVLGGRIEVPTFAGPVQVRLPPGVRPGARLRLAGRGAPSARGDARGDLFFEVRITIPEVRDDRSRDLLREFAERNPESPRAMLHEAIRKDP